MTMKMSLRMHAEKGILLMSEKRKKAKLTPTRSGAQIYMSDSYSKEFLDSIDNR